MKLDPSYDIKIISKWITNLNQQATTIKFLAANLCKLGIGKDILEDKHK